MIRFAPLGGETFIRRVPADRVEDLQDTLVVLTAEGQVLLRSEAILHLLSCLGGGWRRLGRLLARIPRTWRDGGYRVVARLRSRLWPRLWSGRAACPTVPPMGEGRFEP